MKLIKQLLPFKLKRKIKDNLGVPSLHWSLLNLKVCGFDPCRAMNWKYLKGAKICIGNCQVCLLEVSFLELAPGGSVIIGSLNFMDDKGFQAYDISQLMRKPLDKALYQADMFFVKKNSPLLKSRSWS